MVRKPALLSVLAALLTLPGVASAWTHGSLEQYQLPSIHVQVIASFGITLIIALILVSVSSRWHIVVTKQIAEEPGKGFLYGILTFLIVFGAVLFLGVLVGPIVILLVFVPFLLLGVVGSTMAWVTIGRGLATKVGTKSWFAAAFLGALVSALVSAIPILGALVGTVVGFIGIGVVTFRPYK